MGAVRKFFGQVKARQVFETLKILRNLIFQSRADSSNASQPQNSINLSFERKVPLLVYNQHFEHFLLVFQ